MSVFARQLNHRDRESVALPQNTDDARLNSYSTNQSSKPVRRESKLTLGGVTYIVVTVFLAIGAINSQNNLLFWLFGVAIATLIVSGVFSGNALMQVRLDAQAVPDGFAGDEIRLHYMLSNRSKFFPLFAAMITEIQTDQKQPGAFESAAVLHLGPRQNLRATGVFRPTRRGRCVLNRVRLSTRFPFGLLQKSLIFECHRPVMILPYRLDIKPELVRVRRGRADEIRKRTQSIGSSTEFWGLREYTPGDPKRSIAWKQSARHQSLVVIDHAQPIATRLWIWISIAQASDPPDRASLERALALASSLLIESSRRHVPAGLWMPAAGVRMTPGVGRAHTLRGLRSLGLVDLDARVANDPAPPASSNDDVLVVRPGMSEVQRLRGWRVLDADEPSQWLVDDSTLPRALGIATNGVHR